MVKEWVDCYMKCMSHPDPECLSFNLAETEQGLFCQITDTDADADDTEIKDDPTFSLWALAKVYSISITFFS